MKVYYHTNRHKEMLQAYKLMLEYANGAVTRNAAEKKINSTLDFISHSTNPDLLQQFYAMTLQALAEAKNDRLWFKTSIKLANLWISLKQQEEAMKVLKELQLSCRDQSGNDDARKGTQLLEVYALQIQVLSESQTSSKTELAQLYKRALEIRSAIPHPRVMGIIRECGGKMHMNSKNWELAATDFFEAFKSYDEAGSPCRSRCLKYLVLAHMMMESSVDPFDSQEARPYRSDPAVSAMTSLVEAYQASEIHGFEKALREGNKDIAGDSFVEPYIEDLRRKLSAKVIVSMIAPYSRIKIDIIRDALRVTHVDVDGLLLSLLLDKKIKGHIHEVEDVLELAKEDEVPNKFEALRSLSDNLNRLNAHLNSKLTL